jgi:L-seryl-tRNA(Ser) seleniumtransferase
VPDFRVIPSIEQLRQRPAVRTFEAQYGGDATVEALRAAADSVRHGIAVGTHAMASAAAAGDAIETEARARLADAFEPSLQPVINATGVVIHTNLGRAPLSDAALARIREVARGYSSLEYDLGRGARGRRDVHAEALLCRLTGAESAVVVNNNAAATMIVLAALASGREVIVSRGELVEIGGGFRVPDVMAQSGALLREVGTTNKTRASDYAAAVSDRTALILRIHPSNFRIEGFTERPSLTDLVTLAAKLKIPVAEDLGSGELRPVGDGPGTDPGRSQVRPGSVPEPSVRQSVADGVDVCCFSGDKLLGGPQAGIIVGRRCLVDQIRRHPLMRALRVDKLTYAALEATLAEYAAGRAHLTVPVRRMLTLTVDDVRTRAARVAAHFNAAPGWRAALVDSTSAVGGGSAPGVALPTCAIALTHDTLSADAIERHFRAARPPVIVRIESDRVLVDLRTVAPDDDDRLTQAILGH